MEYLKALLQFPIFIILFIISYPLIVLIIIHFITRSQFLRLNLEDMKEISRASSTDVPKIYYEYLRDEIRREDEITHQRLTWSITFQGFLVNALAVLIALSGEMSISAFYMRILALIAISVIGLHIAFISLVGVKSSRNSIKIAKKAWEARNSVWRMYPNKVPQAYGQLNSFHGGSFYSLAMPYLFISMWVAFLIMYINTMYFFEVLPCATSRDLFRCVYDNRMPAMGVIDNIQSNLNRFVSNLVFYASR